MSCTGNVTRSKQTIRSISSSPVSSLSPRYQSTDPPVQQFKEFSRCGHLLVNFHFLWKFLSYDGAWIFTEIQRNENGLVPVRPLHIRPEEWNSITRTQPRPRHVFSLTFECAALSDPLDPTSEPVNNNKMNTHKKKWNIRPLFGFSAQAVTRILSCCVATFSE